MADLVPATAIAAVTELLQAPYLNSFGSTETGLPPATRSLIPIGVAPARLSKRQNAFCEIKLVDPADNEVAAGEPGELAMRGATLFSGYWQADETNTHDFRGGWFHMGDVFRRNEDGTLDFVDRAKYLIKSGGENVYPAEIERVLLSDTRISEAAIVRAPDSKWGEVPVAFVACRDGSVTSSELAALCQRDLASYKRPREFRFRRSRNFRARRAARCNVTSWKLVSPPGARMSEASLRGKAAIIGDRPYRRSARCRGSSPLWLAADAAEKAIADAGLKKSAIDGVLSSHAFASPFHRFSVAFSEYFGLQPTFSNTLQVSGATAATMFNIGAAAIQAVSPKMCCSSPATA